MEVVTLARHLAQCNAADRAAAIWRAAARAVGADVTDDETVFQSHEQQAAFLREVERLERGMA